MVLVDGRWVSGAAGAVLRGAICIKARIFGETRKCTRLIKKPLPFFFFLPSFLENPRNLNNVFPCGSSYEGIVVVEAPE